MQTLALHEVHSALRARFSELAGMEVVNDYGQPAAEYAALRAAAGVIDLSFRGRLCLTGADRVRLLNGQVTNDVKALRVGQGCAAAFCTPKGRLVADVHVFALAEELLLEFEPGLTSALTERLERHIVAEDVQVIDVAPHYGLISIQGPQSGAALGRLDLFPQLPDQALSLVSLCDPTLGELYLVNRRRAGFPGFDWFIPADSVSAVFDKLVAAARDLGGGAVGFDALDLARFEAGIPRFPVDMDETHLPPETGLERTAISYTKGCYTGQETIARLRTYGQVVKALRGLRLPDALAPLPIKGAKLQLDGKDVGYVTSARYSPAARANLALGYIRKGANAPGTELALQTESGAVPARVVELPFVEPTDPTPSPAGY